MAKHRIGLFAGAALAVGAALAWQAPKTLPQNAGLSPVKLPEPYATDSVRNRPDVVVRPEGAELEVPQGFTVEEFASDFERPRIMMYGPSNEILLSESAANGSILILLDKNNDGKPDERKKLIEGLDRPYGMAWWKDYLYVAETTAVKRYKYDKKAMTAGKGEMVVAMPEFAKGHWTRTIAFDPDGKKLYVGVGSASNVSSGEPKERAAINRYNPDGSGFETFASGTRNPTQIGFYPGSKTLWASIQERDEIGDNLVPDYFTHIQEGGFYGWPYAYFGPNRDPRHKDAPADVVKKTIVPDVSLGSHTAVISWTFYNGKQFPSKYRGGAFLALHGSWNRADRVGYSVVFVPFKNGKAAAGPEEFLRGFMTDPTKREVWGRPTGVLEMKDGSILVSDDGGNKIWRISYKG
ncbi:MAG: PQQ-dependent sugar dehydrogenase [Bryobacteraceae bacterium]